MLQNKSSKLYICCRLNQVLLFAPFIWPSTFTSLLWRGAEKYPRSLTLPLCFMGGDGVFVVTCSVWRQAKIVTGLVDVNLQFG